MTTIDMTTVELTIKAKAFEKLRYYVDLCPAEISGFGKIREIPNDDDIKKFELYDVEILPQKVSGSDATMSIEAIAVWLSEKIRRGQNVAPYKLWWHSHNDFQAFFSMTDTKTIDASSDFPFLISLVTNKDGDYVARLDTYKPIRVTMDVKVYIEQVENEPLKRRIQNEIDRKVEILHAATIGGSMYDYDEAPNHKPGWWKGFFGKKQQVAVLDEDDDDDMPLDGETNEAYFERMAEKETIAGNTLYARDFHTDFEEDGRPIKRKGRGPHPGMV